MKFAVNYSKPAEAFVRSGQVHIDLFKLPAWPDVVEKTVSEFAGYIHFPLKVTDGSGTVRDTETKKPVDFARIERFMTQTGTPLVNLHLTPDPKYHPDITSSDLSAEAAEKTTERMLKDVQTLVRHFGAENVIAENDSGDGALLASTLPEVISTVIRESGCGLLFDLSHARLAARTLEMDAKDYISRLPLERLKELHLTGIQYLDEAWHKKIVAAGTVTPERLPRYRDRWIDHLPFTEEDWAFTAWGMEQIRSGAWAEPWVASCECGGIGGFFEATMDEGVMLEQFPRLQKLVHGTD